MNRDYLSRAPSQNFAWHLLWLLTGEGKNVVKLLAISQTCQFQFFWTGLPTNFGKIARLLGKIKNPITLRFISLYFSKQKIVLWEDMSLLVMNNFYNENGQWLRYLWSGGKTFKPCAARTIIILIFQRENLNYWIVCFTQRTAVPVFSVHLISIADLFPVCYLWDLPVGNEDKCCVVTHVQQTL